MSSLENLIDCIDLSTLLGFSCRYFASNSLLLNLIVIERDWPFNTKKSLLGGLNWLWKSILIRTPSENWDFRTFLKSLPFIWGRWIVSSPDWWDALKVPKHFSFFRASAAAPILAEKRVGSEPFQFV